ncbi:phosphatase PAP2 family protein [Xanthomonas nasturtii]|uniref:Acid phosphatase n=1 Tax=Xanthomonas nasturtii TaxID=1843581 RepID=A0A3E1KJ28_9XANT|nr:phosphatase PAP2 family protein [Xanthomonas nasturtii]MCL1530774.1 phosphatase PAP2 family protein [Xanthomonas nasturtii]MCL1565562.1 phosphatase PAP2 family protein [Xanthomonas nasturtii]MCL1569504.1 phosphatase PAP2 family protein [Xanthomonas nasturtii]MCL1573330.1 phosphatase PAP2 family protein [Xanthomonas nasturtii]MCL1581096.1 phosphatase PAP2 family protein [Xanthomonas nasturtii]
MSYRLARPSHRTLAGVVAVALLIGSGSMANARQPAKPADSVLATDVRGYLDKDQLPDSLHLVPPPPQDGSAALANDEAIAKAMLALRGTPRWELAAQDAVLGFPAAASHFSCALGVQIDPASTPHLLRLLERSMRDASTSTSAAKARYQRARPFMRNDQPMCTPADDAALRKNGSYPSGHTAIGWSWGLILSEIAPPHRDALLARGRAFGDSRLVCNVHWQSDVIQGRMLGAATVAALHGNPAFEKDLAAARREIEKAQAKQAAATTVAACKAENQALQTVLPGVM